jgi:hypothetical protein
MPGEQTPNFFNCPSKYVSISLIELYFDEILKCHNLCKFSCLGVLVDVFKLITVCDLAFKFACSHNLSTTKKNVFTPYLLYGLELGCVRHTDNTGCACPIKVCP